jgi:hypothetical protein
MTAYYVKPRNLIETFTNDNKSGNGNETDRSKSEYRTYQEAD